MSELFGSEFIDPMLERVYMYPNVMTDDASALAETYSALSQSGLELDEILEQLEDQHPVDASDLKSWLLADQ